MTQKRSILQKSSTVGDMKKGNQINNENIQETVVKISDEKKQKNNWNKHVWVDAWKH